MGLSDIQSRHSSAIRSRAETSQSTETSRTRSSGMAAFRTNPFGWGSRTSFDATQHLLRSRSDSFILRPRPADKDVWKRPPPDFRPQCYAPKPPKRNSREAMQPWRYSKKQEEEGEAEEEDEEVKMTGQVQLPRLVTQSSDEEEQEEFVTRCRVLTPCGARSMFVRHGQNYPGHYSAPRPHDFRQLASMYSLGQPEFTTNYEHDPYNLKFKGERLNIITGNDPSGGLRDVSGRQMAPPLPRQPSWESRLILPHENWPSKSGEYTRHRRIGRSPHSALMERIEDRLTRQWAHEKLLQKLQQQEQLEAAQQQQQQRVS